MDNLMDNVLENVFVLIFLILLVYLFLHKYCIAILDPIFISIIAIAVSLFDITLIYLDGFINFYEWIKVVSYIITFLSILWLTSLFWNKNKFKYEIRTFLKKEITNKERKFFIIIYTLSIITTLFFSFLMLGADMGDQRIILGSKYRIIDIIKQGCVNELVYILCFSYYYKSKRKMYLYFLIILVVIQAFSGSKGFFFVVLINYMFFVGINTIYNRKNDLKKIFKMVMLLLIACFLGIQALMAYGADFNTALSTFITRIFLASDAYLYAYVWGDYTRLYDLYNPILYFLHPFLRFIGFSGYDYPLGVALFGDVGKGYDGFGPNAIYPVLVNVLGNGDAINTAIIAISLAVISPVFMLILWKYSENKRLMIYYFLAIYFNFINIFTDVGLWEQNIISVTLVMGIAMLLVNKVWN